MLPPQDNIIYSQAMPTTEKKLVPDRFHLKKRLGQGTFSKHYNLKSFTISKTRVDDKL